jgi:hypothetical protein
MTKRIWLLVIAIFVASLLAWFDVISKAQLRGFGEFLACALGAWLWIQTEELLSRVEKLEKEELHSRVEKLERKVAQC